MHLKDTPKPIQFENSQKSENILEQKHRKTDGQSQDSEILGTRTADYRPTKLITIDPLGPSKGSKFKKD